MKYFILIFVFFISCSRKNEKGLTAYFDDGYVDDGFLGFPDFSKIEKEEPDLIYQFDKIVINYNLLSQIEDAIENASPKRIGVSDGFHKMESVYLLFPDSTKNCFFNSSCNFYNTDEEFLFHNTQLAETVKRLIRYKEVLGTELADDVPPALYYKVEATIKDEKR